MTERVSRHQETGSCELQHFPRTTEEMIEHGSTSGRIAGTKSSTTGLGWYETVSAHLAENLRKGLHRAVCVAGEVRGRLARKQPCPAPRTARSTQAMRTHMKARASKVFLET